MRSQKYVYQSDSKQYYTLKYEKNKKIDDNFKNMIKFAKKNSLR